MYYGAADAAEKTAPSASRCSEYFTMSPLAFTSSWTHSGVPFSVKAVVETGTLKNMRTRTAVRNFLSIKGAPGSNYLYEKH